jgi:hypothetical protein
MQSLPSDISGTANAVDTTVYDSVVLKVKMINPAKTDQGQEDSSVVCPVTDTKSDSASKIKLFCAVKDCSKQITNIHIKANAQKVCDKQNISIEQYQKGEKYRALCADHFHKLEIAKSVDSLELKTGKTRTPKADSSSDKKGRTFSVESFLSELQKVAEATTVSAESTSTPVPSLTFSILETDTSAATTVSSTESTLLTKLRSLPQDKIADYLRSHPQDLSQLLKDHPELLTALKAGANK